MPKNSASKCPASSMNPPSPAALPQPRSAGSGVMASTSSATSCHNSSGEFAPPGYRQAMETMATGAPVDASATRNRSRVSCRSAVTRFR